MSSAEFEQRLDRELTMTDYRAVIVVAVAEPDVASAADDAIRAAATTHGIAEEQILRYVVSRDGVGRERLRAHNRERDHLLASKRLIYLRASSAADVRFLREVAPDLTATVDVFVEIEDVRPRGDSWSECSRSLRALMKERHEYLDFTGLLPANVEQRVLPLHDLYQPLVDLDSSRSQVDLFDPRFNTTIHPGWLVLGHPGSGKTTFVRHLAWTYARGSEDPLSLGDKVPLLLSLADYGAARSEDRVRSLAEFLPEWLAEQQVADAEAIASHLPDVLLLLDGLDELHGADIRREVLTELSSLLADGRVGGLVVTGRSYLVDELARQNHRLRQLATRPPRSDQMQAFVRTFVRLRRGSEQHATELIARIELDSDLSVMARTPLMLAFMVILDELEGRLPDRRIEIYYRLGEMLVDRWTRARSIGANATRRERPTRADAMRVLGPLAWWTLERGGGFVPEAALLQEIERIESRRESPDEARRRAAALLELLRSDTALLVPRQNRRRTFLQNWSFVHQSIAEYFAAVEVERDPQRWAGLLDDPFRAEWREIVLFCAGQLGVIDGRTDSLDRLIASILKKSRRAGRYDAKYASLLIGLLTESPGLSRKQIDGLVVRLLDLTFIMDYSLDATFQIHDEFTRLLHDVQIASAERLGAGLRERFATKDGIRWERVFPLGRSDADAGGFKTKFPNFSARDVAVTALGWFGASLVDPWVNAFNIDLKPALANWSKQSEWTFRLAIWWVRSTPEQRELPFSQVASEI